ncbi:atrial natriuretic peptide receptor 3, partial [Biomphalaria glabrata]
TMFASSSLVLLNYTFLLLSAVLINVHEKCMCVTSNQVFTNEISTKALDVIHLIAAARVSEINIKKTITSNTSVLSLAMEYNNPGIDHVSVQFKVRSRNNKHTLNLVACLRTTYQSVWKNALGHHLLHKPDTFAKHYVSQSNGLQMRWKRKMCPRNKWREKRKLSRRLNERNVTIERPVRYSCLFHRRPERENSLMERRGTGYEKYTTNLIIGANEANTRRLQGVNKTQEFTSVENEDNSTLGSNGVRETDESSLPLNFTSGWIVTHCLVEKSFVKELKDYITFPMRIASKFLKFYSELDCAKRFTFIDNKWVMCIKDAFLLRKDFSFKYSYHILSNTILLHVRNCRKFLSKLLVHNLRRGCVYDYQSEKLDKQCIQQAQVSRGHLLKVILTLSASTSNRYVEKTFPLVQILQMTSLVLSAQNSLTRNKRPVQKLNRCPCFSPNYVSSKHMAENTFSESNGLKHMKGRTVRKRLFTFEERQQKKNASRNNFSTLDDTRRQQIMHLLRDHIGANHSVVQQIEALLLSKSKSELGPSSNNQSNEHMRYRRSQEPIQRNEHMRYRRSQEPIQRNEHMRYRRSQEPIQRNEHMRYRRSQEPIQRNEHMRYSRSQEPIQSNEHMRYRRSQEPIQVHVIVLLPFTQNRPFNKARVFGAIELAIQKVIFKQMLPLAQLVPVFDDSMCSISDAMNVAIEFYAKKAVDVFIGPVCDYAVAPIARQTKYWNIPILTPGALAVDFGTQKQTWFPLLTRVGIHMKSLFQPILYTLNLHHWRKVKLLYIQNGFSEVLDRFCHLAMDSMTKLLMMETIGVDHKGYQRETPLLNDFLNELGTEWA